MLLVEGEAHLDRVPLERFTLSILAPGVPMTLTASAPSRRNGRANIASSTGRNNSASADGGALAPSADVINTAGGATSNGRTRVANGSP